MADAKISDKYREVMDDPKAYEKLIAKALSQGTSEPIVKPRPPKGSAPTPTKP